MAATSLYHPLFYGKDGSNIVPEPTPFSIIVYSINVLCLGPPWDFRILNEKVTVLPIHPNTTHPSIYEVSERRVKFRFLSHTSRDLIQLVLMGHKNPYF